MAEANFQHRSLDGHFDGEEVPDAAVSPDDAHPLAGSRGFSSSLSTIRDAGGKQTGSGPASAERRHLSAGKTACWELMRRSGTAARRSV